MFLWNYRPDEVLANVIVKCKLQAEWKNSCYKKLLLNIFCLFLHVLRICADDIETYAIK